MTDVSEPDCQSHLEPHTLYTNHSCYLLLTTKQSWFKSQEQCTKYGGILATFPTLDAMMDVIQYAKVNMTELDNLQLWMGLSRSMWEWITGKSLACEPLFNVGIRLDQLYCVGSKAK